MKIPDKYKLKNTIKYPTTLIIGGLTKLGIELAESLIEQGGYVIIIDSVTPELIEELEIFPEESLISFLDYNSILYLDEEIRRLDYVFYFQHEVRDFKEKISTGDFLMHSNYLDAVLALSEKFDARFLLTTSIKAYNLLSHGSDLLDAFADQQHGSYSAIEFQKYAEGLTNEYVKNKGVNARIVRMGEVIGDGIDFYKKTTFNDLILRAVEGKRLELINDGLENEWFVHVMDASYGLIKAQFAKGTEGQSFSLCYEVTYSHISIAYKIQEIEEAASDIYFTDGDASPPPLKLKKPAPNLSKVGWFPKVSFDTAVSQSLAAAKIFLIEHNARYQTHPEHEDSIQEGLNKFIALASNKKSEPTEIEVSTKKLRNKKLKKENSFSKKLSNIFWNGFISFTNIFSGFKQKSPLEVGGIIFACTFFIAFYFLLLSPFVVLTRNVFIVQDKSRSIQQSFESFEFNLAAKDAETIEARLIESNKILNNYTFFANAAGVGTDYKQLQSSIDKYALYFEGVKNIAESVSGYETYLETYTNPLELRLGSDSYIGTNSSQNYEVLLQSVVNNEARIEAGIQKVEAAVTSLSSEQDSLLSLAGFSSATELSSIPIIPYTRDLIYLAEILGYGNQNDIAVFITDNSEIKPIGGSITSYGLFSLRNGAIVEARIQSIDDANFAVSESTAALALDSINENIFASENASSIDIEDIALIDDISIFEQTATDIIEDSFAVSPDLVLLLNVEALSVIMDIFEDENSVELSGTAVGSSNYISVLDGLIGANQTRSFRNDLISESFAETIFKISENPQRYYPNFYEKLIDLRESGDILISTDTLKLSERVRSENWNRLSHANKAWFAELSITNRDERTISRGMYPDVQVTALTSIDSDLNSQNTLQLIIPGNIENAEVSLCLPSRSETGSLKVTGVPESQYTTRVSVDKKCIVAILSGSREVEFSWNLDRLLPEDVDGEISFAIPKIIGANTSVSYQIEGVDDIILIDENGEVLSSPKVINETLLNNLEIQLEAQR